MINSFKSLTKSLANIPKFSYQQAYPNIDNRYVIKQKIFGIRPPSEVRWLCKMNPKNDEKPIKLDVPNELFMVTALTNKIYKNFDIALFTQLVDTLYLVCDQKYFSQWLPSQQESIRKQIQAAGNTFRFNMKNIEDPNVVKENFRKLQALGYSFTPQFMAFYIWYVVKLIEQKKYTLQDGGYLLVSLASQLTQLTQFEGNLPTVQLTNLIINNSNKISIEAQTWFMYHISKFANHLKHYHFKGFYEGLRDKTLLIGFQSLGQLMEGIITILKTWNLENLQANKKWIPKYCDIISDVIEIQFNREKGIAMEDYFQLIYLSTQALRVADYIDGSRSNSIIEQSSRIIEKLAVGKKLKPITIAREQQLNDILELLIQDPFNELFTANLKTVFLSSIAQTMQVHYFKINAESASKITDYFNQNEEFIKRAKLKFNIDKNTYDAMVDSLQGDSYALRLFTCIEEK